MKRMGSFCWVGALLLGAAAPTVLAEANPFQLETQQIGQNLPCKWVSMGGRTGPSSGSGYFDYSCKGGTWGTVTLLMNARGFTENTLGSIRLGYRDWDPAVNPTAGEAAVAEQFLQYILNRYVPADIAPEAREGFWRGKGAWKSGGTRVRATYEEGNGFVQRWLLIERPQTQTSSLNFGTMPMIPQPWREAPAAPAQNTAQSTGLLKPAETPVPAPNFTPATPQAPVQLPSPALIPQEGLRREAPLQVPVNAPAGPARGAAPKSFLQSATETMRGLTGISALNSPSAPLPPAADLRRLETAPAPESLQPISPPPPVAAELIPPAEPLVNNRPAAPSNFSAYNEAEQLTAAIEARALAENRGVSPSALPLSTVASPSLQIAPLQSPAPAVAVPPAAPTAAPAADQRFAPTRGLPQLKFIPKAEPIDTRGNVIRFEDEGQGL